MIITVIIFANHRPQSFLYHQLNQVRMPPNVYDPQVYNYNSMLPELSYSVRYLLTHNKYFYLVKLMHC